MLEVSEEGGSGAAIKEPPCYRCLFDKPISEAWCHPETCEMLEHWLSDTDFKWETYALGWELNLELKFAIINGSPTNV